MRNIWKGILLASIAFFMLAACGKGETNSEKTGDEPLKVVTSFTISQF